MTLRASSTILGVWMVLFALNASADTPPQLRCTVSYAGATQEIIARPVSDPYTVPTTDIRGRFAFKVVMVRSPHRQARIGIYVYNTDIGPEPVLVQHARYRPPFPAPNQEGSLDLTGQQSIYAGPLERELTYQCSLEGAWS